MAGRVVEKQDGYMDSDALLQWLQAVPANSETDAILGKSVSDLDADEIRKLVSLLGERDVTLRSIVLERLSSKPGEAAGAVVDAFKNGSLGFRLAAMRLLKQWNAPVAEIDPWNPKSINDATLSPLEKWRSEVAAESPKPTESPADDLARRAEIRRRIEALMAQPDALVEAEVSDLASDAKLVHEEGVELMKRMAQQGTRHPDRLRQLVYSLSAGPETRLAQRGPLQALAGADTKSRRLAADVVTQAAGKSDLPLLTALLSDEDALIRELALQNLARVAPDADSTTLTELLKDPDKNVRAGVLKQLAILKSANAISAVQQYLNTEEDTDLLIYAIRFLRATEDELAVSALLSQVDRKQWRVRAAAIEGVGEGIRAIGRQVDSRLRKSAREAILTAVEDEDSFVAAKAASQIGTIVSPASVAAIIDVAKKRPELIPQLSVAFSGDAETSTTLAKEMRRRIETGSGEDREFALSMALNIRRSRTLDKTPDSMFAPTMLIAVAEESENLETRRQAIRMLLQDLQQSLQRELVQSLPFKTPTEVFSRGNDGALGRLASLVDEDPFESVTGLVDLFAGLGLDKAEDSEPQPIAVDQSSLQRVDEFLGVASEPAQPSSPLLPKPKTQRGFITALWSGQPARIRQRSMYKPIATRLLQLREEQSDPILRGLLAAVQVTGSPNAGGWDDQICKDILGWVDATTDDESASGLDRTYQSRLLWVLPAPGEMTGGDAVPESDQRQRLFDSLWDQQDVGRQRELLLDAAMPPGRATFEFLLVQLVEKLGDTSNDANGADGAWDQAVLAGHLLGLLTASGAQRNDVYELLDQYPDFYHQEHPFPKELGPPLVRLCDRYNAAAAASLMVLGNRDLQSAVNVAWKWLEDEDAPVRYRRLAAHALVLGTDLDRPDRRTVIERLLTDDDGEIRKQGLELATNQNSLQSKLWSYFGDSPAFPSFDEIGNEVEVEQLERFVGGDAADESALALALQVIAAPTGERPLDRVIDYAGRAPDDQSRLELLFEVLFRRDREEDLPTLKKAIAWMDKHLNDWQSRPIKQRIQKMKTEAAHDLVTIDESDNGMFWAF